MKNEFYLEAYNQYGQPIYDVYDFKGEIVNLEKYINNEGKLLWEGGEEFLYSINREPVCQLKTNATDVELSFTINSNYYINKISAPNAQQIKVTGCKNLETLICPKATIVDCNDTEKLSSIQAQDVISLNLSNCKADMFHIIDKKFPNIEKLELYQTQIQGGKIEILSENLKDVYIENTTFQTIKIPNVSGSVTMNNSYCMNDTLNIPKAENVVLERTSLNSVIADNAKSIDIRLCEYLDSLFAQRAEIVKIDQPDNFKNIVIPSYTEVEQLEERKEYHKTIK